MLKQVVFVAALAFCASAHFGCGQQSAATQEIMSAASIDLPCDEASIEFIEDKPMQKRVSGCGRTLTYMYKCNPASGGGQDCKWKPVPNEADQ